MTHAYRLPTSVCDQFEHMSEKCRENCNENCRENCCENCRENSRENFVTTMYRCRENSVKIMYAFCVVKMHIESLHFFHGVFTTPLHFFHEVFLAMCAKVLTAISANSNQMPKQQRHKDKSLSLSLCVYIYMGLLTIAYCLWPGASCLLYIAYCLLPIA